MNERFALHDYMRGKNALYHIAIPEKESEAMVSETNYLLRRNCESGEELGIKVIPGDICYIDFGQTYLNECGFQHFGLIVAVVVKKALVVPMTSNRHTYEMAFDENDHPYGRRNLMRIGQPSGMRKPSVLFLNDARFINTARVIDVMAHMPVEEQMFKDVKRRLVHMVMC